MNSYVDYAEQLLQEFVKSFQNLYGPQFVSYNIHNMLHLANDVRKFDTLENFSAFEFESYIARIKQLIRSGNQPLEQVMRRCAEIELLNDTTLDINEGRFILTHPHVNAPIPNGLHDVKQYIPDSENTLL